MTDKLKYRASQFKQLKHTAAQEESPTIRVETEHGETRRLPITVAELSAILAILQVDTGA